jgi:hypothetical protein
MFDKIRNGVKHVDNAVTRVGSFVVPVARHFGQHHIADAAQGIVSGVHQVRNYLDSSVNHVKNHLEKAVTHDAKDLRDKLIYH